MQVTEPLAVLLIREMLMAPLVNKSMPVSVATLTGQLVRHQCGDDGFIVRPPELHIRPVLLRWLAINIAEVQQTTKLAVPTAMPHPIEHAATESNEPMVSADLAFMHDEPGTFDGVTWVQRSTITMVDNRTIRRHRLENGFQVRLTNNVSISWIARSMHVVICPHVRSPSSCEALAR